MTGKTLAAVLAGAVLASLAYGYSIGRTDGRTLAAPPAAFAGTPPTVQLIEGKSIEWWHRRTVQARKDANARGRTIRRLKRTLRHDPSVREAITLAAIVFAQDRDDLEALAYCETGGTMSPSSQNRSSVGGEHASGLFQFLPSTFASTPFRELSIWSPYANALAAGWMHAHGRGGEWVC